MKRLLTAALLIPPVLYLILAAHPLLLLAATVAVALACYYEFTGLARGHGIEIHGPLGYALGIALVAIPHLDAAWLAVAAVFGFLRALRAHALEDVFKQAAAFTLGIAYVFGPWRCAVLLRQIDPHWLLYALALNWIGDMAAYYVGSLAGRHKMAPRISPGKSWEGAAASVVVSCAFGVLYLGRFIPQTDWVTAVALTAAASIAGQLGDLCESAIKRGAGVKDSGALLPGHGGWLDRVDASLFTLPVVYLWLSRASMLR
jgi:phosphatidate cytidylyltransferase